MSHDKQRCHSIFVSITPFCGKSSDSNLMWSVGYSERQLSKISSVPFFPAGDGQYEYLMGSLNVYAEQIVTLTGSITGVVPQS